jgi:hypothetical protein
LISPAQQGRIQNPQYQLSDIMFEYIFFDAALRDKFVDFAQQRSVSCTVTDDHLGLVVSIPEDIPEDVAEQMEDYYDALEGEQANLSETEGDLKRLAGFRFNLPDGQSRMLPLPITVANRLLASFSLEELQELFSTVAECTLNPKDEHLCKILAARDQQD